MNILELFAGSRSIGKVAEKMGMNVFSTDIEAYENIDYVIDILEFNPEEVPFIPDIIWASPPCTFFSVSSIGKHWNKDHTPKSKEAMFGVRLVERTIEIIKYFQDKNPGLIYFVENPRGKLRKLPVTNFFKKRHTVTYCQYGDDRMKPTDIWTNSITWVPRPICKNGDTCHAAAPRGSRTGTQGMIDAYEKSKIPEQLCYEILTIDKMKVNKQNLLAALEIVKPGLANNAVIEQFTSFAFIKGCVVTYNDEISISHPVEGLELEGAIKAEHLYKLLKKLKEDEIEITLEGNEVLIVSGRVKAGLTLESEINLPLDEELTKKGKWKKLPEKAVQHIDFVRTACAKESSNAILSCVHVNKLGYIEASDTFRVVKCTLSEEMPVNTFITPASSASVIVRINPTEIAEGKGWIHFKNEEGTILSCRVVEDSYPNTAPHLEVEGTQLVLPKSIEEMLDRASVFAKRERIVEEEVIITLHKNKFKIRAEAETGWFEEEVNLKYDGKSISFRITPYLLQGILKQTDACIFNERKLKFEGEGWIYMTLLRA